MKCTHYRPAAQSACPGFCPRADVMRGCTLAEEAANDAATAAEAGRQLALGRMVQAALLAGVPFGAAAIAMVVRRW